MMILRDTLIMITME